MLQTTWAWSLTSKTKRSWCLAQDLKAGSLDFKSDGQYSHWTLITPLPGMHTYYMPILTSFVGQKRILPLHFSVSPPQVCHSFQIYIQASLIRNSSSPPCLTHEHWELGLWIILKTKQQIKTEICWRCRLRCTAKYIDLILQLLMIFMIKLNFREEQVAKIISNRSKDSHTKVWYFRMVIIISCHPGPAHFQVLRQ